ncbi:MAG: hypothetical protein DCC50_10055 [Acidobacteria bacterium]|nr:MAG: hypothetical protein DCC50_10055 [Acidobacteriota bacterium]
MFGARRQQEIDVLRRRVRELEDLVQELARRAGVGAAELHTLRSSATGISPEVADLVARGEIIRAVKEYRTRTGAGLKEAKDAVDAYRAGR